MLFGLDFCMIQISMSVSIRGIFYDMKDHLSEQMDDNLASLA